MLKEVMNDLWLARISSLSNEVGLYEVLLGVLISSPITYHIDICVCVCVDKYNLDNSMESLCSKITGHVFHDKIKVFYNQYNISNKSSYFIY